MRSRLVIAAVLTSLGLSGVFAASLGAQPTVKRGRYYRCDDPAFEMWIPAGMAPQALTEKDQEDDGYPLTARFFGRTKGVHEVCVQIYPGGFADPAAFIELDQKCARENRPEAQLVSVGEVAAGPFRGGICWEKGGRKQNSGYKDLATLRAGILFNSERTIEIVCYAEGPRIERAVQQLKWMLGTVRRPGEAGLGRFLAKRRIDTETGLSYRPPRGLKASKPPEGAAFLYRGEGGDPRLTVTLSPATGKTLRRIVKPRDHHKVSVTDRRSLPHEPGVDVELLGGLYRTKDSASAVAVVAARFGPGHDFLVRVEGSFQASDQLLRTAELTAMGLRYVDVESAKKEVAAALAKLAAARESGDSAAVGAAVAVLVRHPYLEGVPSAVAGALEQLPDVAALEAAAETLVEHGTPAELPALLHAVRRSKSKRDHAAVAALVPALATVRGKKAVPLLLDLARRKEVGPAVAALGALGHYREPALKVARKLVPLMARAEKAGRGKKLADRERWLVLRPAFVASLERLTGQSFANAAEAAAWLRKK